jgi:hypothetical protein
MAIDITIVSVNAANGTTTVNFTKGTRTWNNISFSGLPIDDVPTYKQALREQIRSWIASYMSTLDAEAGIRPKAAILALAGTTDSAAD